MNPCDIDSFSDCNQCKSEAIKLESRCYSICNGEERCKRYGKYEFDGHKYCRQHYKLLSGKDPIQDLFQKYEEKLSQKVKEDESFKKDFSRESFNYYFYPDEKSQVKFLEWVIESYLRGGISLAEDIKSRAYPSLSDFQKFRQLKKLKGEEKDLKNYFGLKGGDGKLSLEGVLHKYRKNESEEEYKSNVFYEGVKIKIYQPKTVEESCKYGRGTQWCTAATRGRNMFSEYNENGPLYIIIPKKPKHKDEKYQLHLESYSLMDEHDEHVNFFLFINEYKEIIHIPGIKNYSLGIYNSSSIFPLVERKVEKNHLDDDLWEELEFCEIATEKDYTSFKYTKNQSEEMCIGAIVQDYRNMQYVINQTEKICLAAVREYGLALQFVKNKTRKICEKAVQSTGLALQFVPESLQDEKLIMKAVKENGLSLQYASFQNENICLTAVKNKGIALEFVKEQTTKICLTAVKEEGSSIEYVKNQTEEMCVIAIRSSPYNIEVIKNQTEDLCLLAVSIDGLVIEGIRNPSEQVCIEAIKDNCASYNYIKKEFRTRKVKEYFERNCASV